MLGPKLILHACGQPVLGAGTGKNLKRTPGTDKRKTVTVVVVVLVVVVVVAVGVGVEHP
jgi:uncharacterized membrane protein AbrB (regulator of aidB expression)